MSLGTQPNRTTPHSDDAPAFTWTYQWARVPEPWREGTFHLNGHARDVFALTTQHKMGDKPYEFIAATYSRSRHECSWWLWSIWADGSRKINPSMLTWWGRAIMALIDQRATFGPHPADVSVAEFTPALVVREALTQFNMRRGRYPSSPNVRDLETIAHSIHEHVHVRCTDAPWWSHDTWNLLLDERIPRRPNEPHTDRKLSLANIEPAWLREGIRFWLSQALLHDVYTWSTALTRVATVGGIYGRYCATRDLTPNVAADLGELRATFMDYLSYLRSPEATRTGKALAPTGVAQAQSHLQAFYTFMTDHADEAATFTGDERWRDLTINHTRLWAPAYAPRRRGNQTQVHYYADSDLAALLAHLPILAAPTSETLTIEHGGQTRTFWGLGDPQAARIWELQELTGRRASEICLIDRDPLTLLDLGEGPASGNADPDAFVARLRYQQTKIDDVDPTILVQQSVVNIIREQQQWLTDNLPADASCTHLFIQPRNNRLGLLPRTYRSYVSALNRLTKAAQLTDTNGRRLTYSQTHRLRHTRATTLLNAGVPMHVVMRYLGHKSPEMTMRYAETLDSTALDQFSRYKQVGADGREVTINPRDLIDLQQLDQRADRILPNGLCLLPPTKTCDKGNACLPCGSFATDVTHLPDHHTQRERIAALIQVRRTQFEQRHGTPMPDTNVWLQGRLRELASLDAIIARLEQDDTGAGAVKGAGASAKSAPLTLTSDPASRDAARQALTDRLNTP